MKRIVIVMLTLGLVGCGASQSTDEIIADLQAQALTSGVDPAFQSLSSKCGKPGNAPSRKCPEIIYIRGDATQDNLLTDADIPAFTQAVHTVADAYCPAALDVNLDGIVDQADVGVFHSGLNSYLNGGDLPWKTNLFIKASDCNKVTF